MKHGLPRNSQAGHLYLHIPFCSAKCHYCALYSVVAHDGEHRDFAALLLREYELHSSELTPLETIYIGGGTPAMLGLSGLRTLTRGLAERRLTDKAAEWTVELNPASTDRELLQLLRASGVNRLSFGAQSFDDATLIRIGRGHDAAAIERSLAQAAAFGFDNLGLDLIAGLPGVSDSVWRQTLQRACASGCRHLSVYGLMLEPGSGLQRQVAAGLQLPDAAAQLDALALAEELLQAEGFERYEISNYARPGYRCRHNLAVWQGADYLGLGPAAASRIGLRRWTNAANLEAWQSALRSDKLPPVESSDTLTAADDAIERTLFKLRLASGLTPDELRERLPALTAQADTWQKRLSQLEQHNITEAVPGRSGSWRLTARGREVADSVMEALL